MSPAYGGREVTLNEIEGNGSSRLAVHDAKVEQISGILKNRKGETTKCLKGKSIISGHGSTWQINRC